MTKRFFTVFRAGKYPQGEFPRSAVEAVAKHYDPSFSEAPITIDHAKSGPAFGWIEEARAVGDDLQVAFRDVAPEFKESVDVGRYRKVSIELFRRLEGRAPYLKAVTFLGATPPQIKDLPQITFKDGETDTFEFEMIDAAVDPPVAPAPPAAPADGNDQVAQLSARVSELTTQVARFAEVDADRVKAEGELERLRCQMRRMEFEQFLNERIAWGNVTPAMKDTCLKLLEAMSGVAAFSDGSQPVDQFKDFLTALPKVVVFDELANKRTAPGNTIDLTDPKAIAAAAIEFQDSESKAGRTITVTAAVAAVTKGK
ncbi:MAG: hypothetical protein C4529_08920 [Deltaproteobacteria bacterium]|nr:MAG: hypothetical protein C4529_08920 [Deltaproteobacteria bacterium]